MATPVEVLFVAAGSGLVLAVLLDSLWTSLWVDGGAGPISRVVMRSGLRRRWWFYWTCRRRLCLHFGAANGFVGVAVKHAALEGALLVLVRTTSKASGHDHGESEREREAIEGARYGWSPHACRSAGTSCGCQGVAVAARVFFVAARLRRLRGHSLSWRVRLRGQGRMGTRGDTWRLGPGVSRAGGTPWGACCARAGVLRDTRPPCGRPGL